MAHPTVGNPESHIIWPWNPALEFDGHQQPFLIMCSISYAIHWVLSNFMFAEHNRRPSRERERGTQIERELRKRL
jgi:hypothetical protein